MLLYAKSMSKVSTMPTSILSVRVNETEHSLLETAAKQVHTTLSEFVRCKAAESAELDVMEWRIIEIPITGTGDLQQNGF